MNMNDLNKRQRPMTALQVCQPRCGSWCFTCCAWERSALSGPRGPGWHVPRFGEQRGWISDADYKEGTRPWPSWMPGPLAQLLAIYLR